MKLTRYLYIVSFAVIVAAFSFYSVQIWGGKPEKIEHYDITISSADMTPVEIAQSNKIPLQPVAKALGIDTARASTITLIDLGLTTNEAAANISKMMVRFEEQRSKNWIKIFIKFILWLGILPIPFILLLRKKIDPKKRKWLLATGIVIFGIALGSDPSPMGTVKDAVFLLTAHKTIFWPRIVALMIFLATVVIANKFICSWGCQFGLFQEFLFRLNRRKRDKRGLTRQVKIPFWISNTARVAVFGAITAVGLIWAFDFIEIIDPFKIYNPIVMGIAGIVFLIILILLSPYIYRPWCHFACPFGLVSWVFEKLAIFRIKVNYHECTACDACQRACPSTVMGAILKRDKLVTPDCFSCGTCIESCPTDAISFSASRKNQGNYEMAFKLSDEAKRELLIAARNEPD